MNHPLRLSTLALAAIVLGHAPRAHAQQTPRPAGNSPATSPAHAASPAPPAPSATPLADSLTGDAKRDYESGKILYGDADYAGALVKFRLAYDASRDPRLLWNEAACEKGLRHYAKVMGLVHRVLAEGGAVLTETTRGEADDLVRALEPLTARLQLAVTPDGADVYVDGELLGATPLAEAPLLDFGTRQLRVTKDGYKESATALEVAGAGVVRAAVTLERVVHEGTLAVQAAHGSSVAIDGRVLALDRWQGSLASGSHTLRVTAPGKRPYQTEVVVQDDQVRTMEVALEDETRPAGVPAWLWVTGGAVVLAGASVGAYFLFKPSDAASPSVIGTIAPGTVQLAWGRRR